MWKQQIVLNSNAKAFGMKVKEQKDDSRSISGSYKG